MNYNYQSINLYFMKFILCFHYDWIFIIVMSFILVPDINITVMSFVPNINIRYIWHQHEKSFSLQHSFKTYQISFWMIQILHLLVIWGLECKFCSIEKKCLIFGGKSWYDKFKWMYKHYFKWKYRRNIYWG